MLVRRVRLITGVTLIGDRSWMPALGERLARREWVTRVVVNVVLAILSGVLITLSS